MRILTNGKSGCQLTYRNFEATTPSFFKLSDPLIVTKNSSPTTHILKISDGTEWLCRPIASIHSNTLFAHHLDLDGPFSCAGLIKINEIDIAKLTHIQLAVHDDHSFASANQR